MKKLLIILSMFFILASCDNGNMEVNPFIGTWENDANRWVFTTTYVTLYEKVNEYIYWKGAYSYSDTQLTVTTDYRDITFENYEIYPNPFIFAYSFIDNTLKIGLATVLVKVSD